MKMVRNSLIACGLFSLLAGSIFAAEQLAFPSAEGYGRFAIGGRGGEVYAVTNLNDKGPGSLRDGLSAPNRTIVFRVSGTIELESDLFLSQSNITIAGQTAPGDGICLKKYPLRILGANNVVVRYLRVRPGLDSKQAIDGIEARESSNVIIDHCSVSWSQDEAINTWHQAKNITVQWCMISEPLEKAYNRGPHAFGASWGGQNASFHHNLLAHCTARNPSVGGNSDNHTVNMDYRCCVIYNWQHRTCDGKPDSCNVVNNTYKPGPATHDDVKRRIVKIDDTMRGYHFNSYWYIDGNEIIGAPDLTADNWKGGVEFDGATSEAGNRSKTPFPFAPVTTQSASESYKLVLAKVGATLPKRDSVDSRVIHEVETGTATFGRKGIIDNPTQVGGWPELKSLPAPVDSDNDGMPDAWEKAHGLNPQDPKDRNQIGSDGYTRLEQYLNELVAPKI